MTAKASNRLAIGGHSPTDIWSELHWSFCHSSAFVNLGSCFRPKWPPVILVFNQYDSAGYNKTESAKLRLLFSSHLVSSHLLNRFIAFGVTGGCTYGRRQVPLDESAVHGRALYEHLWARNLAQGYRHSALTIFCHLPLLPERLPCFVFTETRTENPLSVKRLGRPL